jgi:hypothetical protein
MRKHPRTVLSRAARTVATNRAHVAPVAPERTGWTCAARPSAAPGQGRAPVRRVHIPRSVPIVPINRSLRVRGHVVCRTDDMAKNNQDIGYIGTYS